MLKGVRDSDLTFKQLHIILTTLGEQLGLPKPSLRAKITLLFSILFRDYGTCCFLLVDYGT